VSIERAYIKLSTAFTVSSVALFTTFAFGQHPSIRQDSTNSGVAVVMEESIPIDLRSEVEAVKAENASILELLRKMEDQQKAISEQVERLQRRLDETAPDPIPAETPVAPTEQPGESEPAGTQAGATAAALPASLAQTALTADDKYQEGILLVETGPGARIPLRLRLNNVTQFRYLNTLATNKTFTDHLGNVREVAQRHDLTVNREMMTFAGHIFDPRLTFGLLTWTSAATTQVVVSGTVSWRFNQAITLNTGYWGVPGTRTLTFTFPYFTQPERSMADNFFRPGFTQGIWFTGEPVKGLYYDYFIGNGLSTLTIPVSNIDTNLVHSASVWWEPSGPYGPEGKARNMYDDYFLSEQPVIRVGSSFTHSREDRFSNLDQGNPENTSIHNSNGVLAFSTGAFAPGVTLQEATFRMWAIDGGIKYRGLSINGQYYFRWLNDFLSDGPLPVSSTFDHGGEISASYFFIPRKWMMYGRGSWVRGEFGNSYEYVPGFKWFFVPTQHVWLTGEALRIHKSPYGSTITQYTGGMTGWAPTLQMIFAF
jgi:hypothetical protein